MSDNPIFTKISKTQKRPTDARAGGNADSKPCPIGYCQLMMMICNSDKNVVLDLVYDGKQMQCDREEEL